MLKKQRKWLSWTLVMALLLSLLPANVQPVHAATYTNPTLEAAANSVTNKSLPVLNLSNKNITGEVNVAELKGTDSNQFPNLVKVNLQGNFLTKVNGVAGVTTAVEGNLFDPANPTQISDKAKLKLTDESAISRKQATPTPISITDLWDTIVSKEATNTTLKDLVAMGVVDEIAIEYKTTAPATLTVTDNTVDTVADVSLAIPATDVPNLDTTQKIKVTVKYKNLGATPVSVERAVVLKVPTLKITGISDNATLYRGVSKVDVTVTRLNDDDQPLDIAAVGDIVWSTNPAGQPITVVAGTAKLYAATK